MAVIATATATVWALPAGAAPPAAPVFVPGPCPGGLTAPTLECGTVTVPERRDDPDGNQVVLAVAVIHPPTAESEIAEPPLLYLSGGPGDSALSQLPDRVEHPLVTDRDVILVDLRGIGASTPSLSCPEIDDAAFFGTATYAPDRRPTYLAQVQACRDRLVDDGVDLTAYDSAETVADLVDLRRALGIDEWSVYGVSNGGRLALELARRHPDGIASLVLDSPVAPQGNFFLDRWPRADRAFDALFRACEQDTMCAAAHPDLEARFYDLVERLRADPVTADGIVFDDRNTIEILRNGMYDTSLIPAIPGLIDQLSRGQAFDLVASQVRAAQTDPFALAYSDGTGFSTSCREEVAFARPAQLAALAKRLPELRRVVLDDTFLDECEVWDVGRADRSFGRPVRTDIPALILAGELDPATGLPSAEAVARTLPNGRVVELPGLGHAVAFAGVDCPREIIRAFLLAPDGPLDTTCAIAMPEPSFG